MKKLLLVTVAIGSAAFAATAAASGTATGVIAKIEAGPLHSGKVYFQVTNTTGQPACQSGSWHFVFDSVAAGGKETLATLLMAKSMQQTVSVSGNGVCTLAAGSEDLRWFRLE
jgi:hypothetical protein